MALKSDLTLDVSKFDPSAVLPETLELNKQIQKVMGEHKYWFELSDITEARRLQYEAKVLPFQNPPHPAAQPFEIPSRAPGRSITCRLFRPAETSTRPSSIFLHYHGGGFVHGDADIMGVLLNHLATKLNLICISVDYRLAPENKFPAGHEDCFDAAEWLIDNGCNAFDGATLAFISGESAGGNLTLTVTLHLLQHTNLAYSTYRLKGIIPHYPVTAIAVLPSVRHMDYHPLLVLDEKVMHNYIEATLPADVDGKDPAIAPLYAKLKGLALPPALFTVGTEDALLDDALFMGVKWIAAGGEAIVKVMPGAAHGYIENPDIDGSDNIRKGIEYVKAFITSRFAE